MSYVAGNPKKYIGISVGSGQCVALVQAAASTGQTGRWSRGELVKGATLSAGTAIATFDDKGSYISDTDGLSHAAIYMGQSAEGIQVIDQWVLRQKDDKGASVRTHKVAAERTIYFRNSTKPINDGRNYYVID
jgi:hypothetical protein